MHLSIDTAYIHIVLHSHQRPHRFTSLSSAGVEADPYDIAAWDGRLREAERQAQSTWAAVRG